MGNLLGRFPDLAWLTSEGYPLSASFWDVSFLRVRVHFDKFATFLGW
jgi:hypothetical protein